MADRPGEHQPLESTTVFGSTVSRNADSRKSHQVTLASASSERGELLKQLMSVVRSEFRVDVFVPSPDDPIFYPGSCAVSSCPAAVRFIRCGLCESHNSWWQKAGRPPVDEWIAEAERRVQAELIVTKCSVKGCNRAMRRYQLCQRHEDRWDHAGRPPMERWLPGTEYVTPYDDEHGCRYPHCVRWTDGPLNPFCALHSRRWVHAGRPELDGWIAQIPGRVDPRVDLSVLPPPLRLEVQFGLQARHDEGAKVTRMPKIVTAVNVIRRAGVRSLLDWDDEQWRSYTRRPNAGGAAYQSFILDTCFQLRRLLNDDPWICEFTKLVWDLKALGLHRGDLRHIDFRRVGPTWLLDLVRRWARWRLVRGLAPGTVNNGVYAVALLGEHLRSRHGDDAGPQALTREVLETWLAVLVTLLPDSQSRRSAVGGVATFLSDVERHEWCELLPRSARIYDDDYPKRKQPRSRWVPEYLMRQLEDPGNLARFRNDEGRLVLQILIQCGLRIGDARKLPLDCLTYDREQAPYLAWVNHKMNERVAFFPVTTQLAALITEQQLRQQNRFPKGTPYLFTAQQGNLNGKKPLHASTWREHLNEWLVAIELVDEYGRPAHITPHQFRHTVATRLLNSDVPAHVVQDLLDHMSPEMTARYAKLLDTTKRRHWEAAMKVNAEGEPVAIAPEHPLADARWTKLSLVRAKVTLPNGYCGAPIQIDCEYANPCLDCRFFITTTDFLAQHRRQRDETRKLIVDAEQAGLARVAEKNQRTAKKLDKLITVLEQASDGDVVVGGRREDHAAG